MAEAVAAQVDLEQVRALAASAPAWTPQHAPEPAVIHVRPLARAGVPVRIAVARDAAFGFYYPDDLAALEAAGARLLPFDTLNDAQLPPDIDGLFIGGGFPEAFLQPLQANASLRADIRQAIAAGLPTYAECGGLMYLARSIQWLGKTAEMVGAIPGDVVMHPKPVGRGYVRLAETGQGPWPLQPLADGSLPLRLGHEFHHSSLDNLPAETRFAYAVQRGHGVTGRFDGVCVHNTLASYSHLRHTGGNGWPQRFVSFVRSVHSARHAPGLCWATGASRNFSPASHQEPSPCSA
jgi:cobyrinic acid a,c-diamide synthase